MKLKFKQNDPKDLWLCSCEQLDGIVIGRGSSKIQALESFLRGIKINLTEWDNNLTYGYIEESGVLQQWSFMKDLLRDFSEHEYEAVLVAPIKGDE